MEDYIIAARKTATVCASNSISNEYVNVGRSLQIVIYFEHELTSLKVLMTIL